jgi:hypothetical protein
VLGRAAWHFARSQAGDHAARRRRPTYDHPLGVEGTLSLLCVVAALAIFVRRRR